MSRKSRIEKLKKEYEKLIEDFQTFCLDPNVDKYKKIIESKKIRINEGDDYSIWLLAVNDKYDFSKKNNNHNENDFLEKRSKILTNIMANPTRSLLNKVWHMFFATGEYLYLEIAYQTIGNKKGKQSFQEYAADLYIKIKEMYLKKISNFNEDHFRKLEKYNIKKNVIDFSLLEYNAKKYNIEDAEEIVFDFIKDSKDYTPHNINQTFKNVLE